MNTTSMLTRVTRRAASTTATSTTAAAATTSSPTPITMMAQQQAQQGSNLSASAPSAPSSSSAAAHHNLPSPVFGQHVPIKPKHGIHVATLHFRSHTTSLQSLELFTSFAARSARALAIPTTGTVSLPTRTSLFTTPRSPFAHKKSQQNFWRKEHKRALKVYDANPHVVEAWLAFLRKEAIGGVGMKAQVFTYKELGWGQQLAKPATTTTTTTAATTATTRKQQLQQQHSVGTGPVDRGSEGGAVQALAKELQQELQLEVDGAEEGSGSGPAAAAAAAAPVESRATKSTPRELEETTEESESATTSREASPSPSSSNGDKSALPESGTAGEK